MPPRYAYWTILVDGGPTAFRAAEPDELLPTLKRLQVKQPDAVMKWFEKGRLWDSRDEAREKLSLGYTVDAKGELVPPAEGEKPRTKSWRPGGEHRDPREKYQLAKKAKWQAFKKMVRSRPGHGRKQAQEDVFAPLDSDTPRTQPEGGDDATEPLTSEPSLPGIDDAAFDEAFAQAKFDDGGDAGANEDEVPGGGETDWRGRPKAPAGSGAPRGRGGWSDRPKAAGFRGGGDRPRGPKPEWRDRGPQSDRGPKPFDRGGDRPRGPKPAWRDKPQGEWRGTSSGERPAWKPRPDGDRPRGPKPEWRDRAPKPFDRDGGDRPRGPKPAWRDKPQGEWRGKPSGDRPAWKPRPDGDRPRGPKPEWRDKPQGEWRGKPSGDRPAWKPRPDGDRPRGPKPEWRDKPQGEWRGKPSGDRPAWKPRPDGDRPRGPKPEWRDRGPKSFDRGPKSFDRGGDRPRGPKPEWRDRGPKSFDRGPKSFDRGGDRPKGGPGGKGRAGGFKPAGRGRSGPPKRKP